MNFVDSETCFRKGITMHQMTNVIRNTTFAFKDYKKKRIVVKVISKDNRIMRM